jgi:hypothetical protein
MSGDRKTSTPLIFRRAIWLASRIVPRPLRHDWRSTKEHALESVWILSERGELPRVSQYIAPLLLSAVADAVRLRAGNFDFQQFVRGPTFVITAALSLPVLTAVCTGGLAATRSLFDMARHLPRIHGQPALVGPGGDALVGHMVVIAFALVTGCVVAVFHWPRLDHRGWRYWSFLAVKTSSIVLTLPLLWIEVGSAIRNQIPYEGLRVFGGGVVPVVILTALLAWAVTWSFSDQRQRCPVCLSRMAMPVTIGSWASIFDPPLTEHLCEQGHGALCVPENDFGTPERWNEFDASWQTSLV